MSDWLQPATFVMALALTIFNAGLYYNARAFSEWRKRVDEILKPLAGLPEWKTQVMAQRTELAQRVEYVHVEAKNRDAQMREDLHASVDYVNRTFVTTRECLARHEER